MTAREKIKRYLFNRYCIKKKKTKIIIKENITELIIALNPSSNGETTMSFITSKLKRKNLKITRLATGLPIGGDIEYTTSKTLASAIKNRNEV